MQKVLVLVDEKGVNGLDVGVGAVDDVAVLGS